ncbi:S1 family peptidase [Nocardia stercoris]|uniref:Protease n=1 Tax=Nocardia stercoris TaxID=2483361 RepID=A0A3M2KYQ7_9NOCA|nr:S1 family peptidase [Nocardia stercoris]RMI28695.1 protease [Nocardia stercoris]
MLLPRTHSSTAARTAQSTLRKATVVASAALLVAGPFVAQAAADPAPAPVPSVALPADLVDAVQRDLKLSPADYLHRADVAQQLGAFAATAQQQYPAVFGGAWLDQAGNPIVGLTHGAGAGAARQAAQNAGFQVRDVAKSADQLSEEKAAFQMWLTGQPHDTAEAVRGAVVDIANNTVAVRVDKAGLPMPSFIDPTRVLVTAPPVVAEPIDGSAVGVSAGGGPGGSEAAGDGYVARTPERSLRCSLGFNGTDANGNVVNITAGHCNPNVSTAGTDAAATVYDLVGDSTGVQVGTISQSSLANEDYSIVAINGDNAGRFSNSLVRVPGQAPVTLTGTALPVVGAPVCKSGSRSGFNCGTVNAVDQVVQVGSRQMTHSFSANICAVQGDSGGPIITGTSALGISSASSVPDNKIVGQPDIDQVLNQYCQVADINGMITGNTPQLYGQPIQAVLDENPGLSIRTN